MQLNTAKFKLAGDQFAIRVAGYLWKVSTTTTTSEQSGAHRMGHGDNFGSRNISGYQ